MFPNASKQRVPKRLEKSLEHKAHVVGALQCRSRSKSQPMQVAQGTSEVPITTYPFVPLDAAHHQPFKLKWGQAGATGSPGDGRDQPSAWGPAQGVEQMPLIQKDIPVVLLPQPAPRSCPAKGTAQGLQSLKAKPTKPGLWLHPGCRGQASSISLRHMWLQCLALPLWLLMFV